MVQCKTATKKRGLCKARINQTIPPDKVDCCVITSQIVIFDDCLCRSLHHPDRRGVSASVKSKINRILDRGMHLQPHQIVLMVLNNITNIDDMQSPTLIGTNTNTADTRAKLLKQITRYVKKKKNEVRMGTPKTFTLYKILLSSRTNTSLHYLKHPIWNYIRN
jgi:hypothetical protein